MSRFTSGDLVHLSLLLLLGVLPVEAQNLSRLEGVVAVADSQHRDRCRGQLR